jgi:hypothetical protein
MDVKRILFLLRQAPYRTGHALVLNATSALNPTEPTAKAGL